jgi:hypothetical protein
MLKFTLIEDGAPIWIAPWHVVQIFPTGNGGTTIHCVGQIASHVREAPPDVAQLVSLRGRR